MTIQLMNSHLHHPATMCTVTAWTLRVPNATCKRHVYCIFHSQMVSQPTPTKLKLIPITPCSTRGEHPSAFFIARKLAAAPAKVRTGG